MFRRNPFTILSESYAGHVQYVHTEARDLTAAIHFAREYAQGHNGTTTVFDGPRIIANL